MQDLPRVWPVGLRKSLGPRDWELRALVSMRSFSRVPSVFASSTVDPKFPLTVIVEFVSERSRKVLAMATDWASTNAWSSFR